MSGKEKYFLFHPIPPHHPDSKHFKPIYIGAIFINFIRSVTRKYDIGKCVEEPFKLPLTEFHYTGWMRDAGGWVEAIYVDKKGNEKILKLEPISRET